MTTPKTVVDVLAEAENRLRGLVGEAVGSGEYDLAVRVTNVARDVAKLALLFQDEGSSAVIDAPPAIPPAASVAAPQTAERPNPTAARPAARASARTTKKKVKRTGRTQKKGTYPKFFRDGDYLVKVSWSKKQRKEYQHKAPRRVAELLASAISARVANGRMFTTEDIFPLHDPDTGDVPSSQAYAVLAWFRLCGIVQPHGRKGYTAGNGGRLPELFTTAWQSLPSSER